MKNKYLARCFRALLALLFLVAGAYPVQAQQAGKKLRKITGNRPETLGFSSERLERLHAVMQQLVDQKQLSGIVTLLARHGKMAEECAYGQKDMASGAPMTTDTIFRIYSMTKPITGAAMMILYEEGKWKPSDPISKFIPELAHLKVFKGVDANGKMILEDPAHPPTMHELMTHTAGFTYGLFGNTPVDKMYMDQQVLNSKSLQDFIDKLAKIPLLYQPGQGWVYSVSMDVQGYIIEKLSGQTFPDFVQQHILGPLGMKDSGFYVPKGKLNRFATLYGGGPNGELVAPGNTSGGDFTSPPLMPSGGGGMVSTAEDYLRFAQMLLNGGELNGVRILAPSSVKLMTTNHLPPSLLTGKFGIGTFLMRPGVGWAYDCAVFTDPLRVDEPVGKGTFFWSGAADTWFWVDPTNDLIFVGMTQRMIGPGWPDVNGVSHPAVYQALVNPKM
jgi:CubicO group peptidase (beta-lactamase class C family)